jgi:RND family efflux transporter MFP subunit
MQVDERHARVLTVGDAVAVTVDASGEDGEMRGRISEVARAMDPAAHAFLAKVQLPKGAPVRSGMFARATFSAGERQALVVPSAAIVRRGQLAMVFVVDAEGRARTRAVYLGVVRDTLQEVLAGLDQTERVIVASPASLTDGMPVRATSGGAP